VVDRANAASAGCEGEWLELCRAARSVRREWWADRIRAAAAGGEVFGVRVSRFAASAMAAAIRDHLWEYEGEPDVELRDFLPLDKALVKDPSPAVVGEFIAELDSGPAPLICWALRWIAPLDQVFDSVVCGTEDPEDLRESALRLVGGYVVLLTSHGYVLSDVEVDALEAIEAAIDAGE
ncbi:MAG: hypothetical protein QM662_19250, partial [Gordonia sp. (in: high G+C Gram-positive bacteria)]